MEEEGYLKVSMRRKAIQTRDEHRPRIKTLAVMMMDTDRDGPV